MSERPDYGKCPTCGAPSVLRERRINGNDQCANGHWYPSVKATRTPTLTVNLLFMLRRHPQENLGDWFGELANLAMDLIVENASEVAIDFAGAVPTEANELRTWFWAD